MNILRFKKLKNWKIVLVILLVAMIFGVQPQTTYAISIVA